MVVDSSQFHTSYTLFQFCDNNHPRVLRYGYRTWESRFSKLIQALRELYGLVSSLENVMTEVEYTKGGLMISTDSLPVILCTIYAKQNSKIAR